MFTVNGPSLSSAVSALQSLLLLSLMSVVHGGEYLTVSRSSAIVNITYHNPVTDSMHNEVRRLLTFLSFDF